MCRGLCLITKVNPNTKIDVLLSNAEISEAIWATPEISLGKKSIYEEGL